MNNSMILGQYYHANSIIHRLDSRTKLVSLILIMVAIFVIPENTNIPYLQFILMGGFLILVIITMILSKIPIGKFIKSYRHILFLILLSCAIQLLFNKGDGEVLYTINFNFTLVNILIVLLTFTLFFIFRKYLKAKLLIFALLLVGAIFLCQYPIIDKPFILQPSGVLLYKYGLVKGAYTVLRVIIIISFSTILTLTTKPIDISNAIEWLLKPLELLKIKTSIFAMMISIALRFIPTLFNETDKILKAQASRGVDFKESSLSAQVVQIVSLLVPMFVISFKRAADLADAMEARGYIPGEKRTKLLKMQFQAFDIVILVFVVSIFIGSIVGRVIL